MSVKEDRRLSAAQRVRKYVDTGGFIARSDGMRVAHNKDGAQLLVADLSTLIAKAEAADEMSDAMEAFGKLSIPITHPTEELLKVLQSMGASLKSYKAVR